MRLILLPDLSQTYEIKRIGVKVSVGRKQGCDILLPDIVVSGCHCYITVNGPDSASVEDVSTNGTYINGVKVGKGLKLELREGDVLTLGKPNAGAPPGSASGCVNFKISFEGQDSNPNIPTTGATDSVIWRQEVEDLKVLVSQADHRSQMSDRKSQELQFKLTNVEAELKRIKEDNVELLVRNESMRKEIEELRSRLQVADRAAFEADKRAETLQSKVDFMSKEFAEIAALKASLNLKQTTLTEEVERLRRENAELNSRRTMSADVKRRLLANLQQVQQIVGGCMPMIDDMGAVAGELASPLVRRQTTAVPTNIINNRGYPLMAEGVAAGTPPPTDNYFIGSGVAGMTEAQSDSMMFPTRMNTTNNM